MTVPATEVAASGPNPEPDVPAPSGRRRHDLDALRGFAMLLGLGLHASLAFFPAGWPVTDSTANEDGWFDEFFHAVHGFRMPVFFLMSGYFTTMLLRRRGLTSLLRQRATRVALPLLIGAFTVVPLVDEVVERAATPLQVIEGAVIAGDVDATREAIDAGFDVTTRRGDGGTMLHLAGFAGHVDIIELLVAAGVDPRAVDGLGASPTASAVWAGDADAAELLVAAGAFDERRGISRFEDISWFGDGGDFRDEVLAAGAELKAEGPESWIERFHHLWFLWFLCLFVVGYTIAVGIAAVARRATGRDRVLPEQAVTAMMWLLLPVTLWPQYLMGNSGESRIFGPDTSTELVPHIHVLAYYAVFFAFGALMYSARDRGGAELADTLGRRWGFVLPIVVVVVLPYGMAVTFEEVDGTWAIAAVLQVVYTWGMIFGLIGLFRQTLSVERRGVRYLSDSAYWLYLMHLPLMIAGQDLVRDWDLPAEVKFIGLCVVITALLLVTYQSFVRYTPIGWLLNGRRTPTHFVRNPGDRVPATTS